jgi:hypothetical protein
MPNARFTQPTFENGQEVRGWNLTQILPHTPIGEGVTGLRFVSCNLLNCDVPEDATVEDCLTVQKSFCSHLHPEWVAKGLPQCEEDCEHVANVDEVIIDGETIVLRTYDDKGVA